VAEQDVWLARVFLFRNDPKRDHIFDKLIKAAGSKVAKAIGRLGRLAMSAVIIPVNDELISHQDPG
jgi:hypothetical protein